MAQRSLTGPVLDYFEVVSEDESICGAGLRTSQPVWIPDLARSSILADTPALDVLLDAGVRALASLPVHAPDPLDLRGEPQRTDTTTSQRVDPRIE